VRDEQPRRRLPHGLGVEHADRQRCRMHLRPSDRREVRQECRQRDPARARAPDVDAVARADGAHDIDGRLWQDVDTPETKKHTEWLLRAYGQELREFRGRLNVLRQKLDGERKLQALRRQLAADNDHDPTYYGYPQSYYDEVAELEGWFHELEATHNRLRQLSN